MHYLNEFIKKVEPLGGHEMILAINYADDRYKVTQKFNTKCALKFGADKAREYSPEDLSAEFREKNKDILTCPRGGGYWLWKPYIIKDALTKVNEGDYVVYTDSGSAFINKIEYLIDAMSRVGTDVMVFSIAHLEKYYTKRDVFILMDCDTPEYYDTPQICGGYIILKKTEYSCQFIEKFLHYASDARIITDDENVMGKNNYDGFVDNRHDQSVLSLLCKKEGIPPFRDPSEWGMKKEEFSDAINARSIYPQMIESHRKPTLNKFYQLKYRRLYRMLKSKRLF